MKNIQKTRDWLHMALKEFDAALADYKEERNSVKTLGLSKDEVKYLIDIVTFSSPLERQGTMPRYGWETKERIITPDEIYKKESADAMMKMLFNC